MTDCEALLELASLPPEIPAIVRIIEQASRDTGASIMVFSATGKPMCGVHRFEAATVGIELTARNRDKAPYEAFRDAVACLANQQKGQ